MLLLQNTYTCLQISANRRVPQIFPSHQAAKLKRKFFDSYMMGKSDINPPFVKTARSPRILFPFRPTFVVLV